MRSQVCSLQLLLGITSAAFLSSEPHRTREHILLSLFLRLPQPGGPGSCIYFPQEQGSPVIPPDTWVCLINLHIIAWYICSSYMYNTYIGPPLFQARYSRLCPIKGSSGCSTSLIICHMPWSWSYSCGRQSVDQCVWVSGLPLGPLTRCYLALLSSCLTVTLFCFQCVLSDEKTGL
jgi:hypothetical protein